MLHHHWHVNDRCLSVCAVCVLRSVPAPHQRTGAAETLLSGHDAPAALLQKQHPPQQLPALQTQQHRGTRPRYEHHPHQSHHTAPPNRLHTYCSITEHCMAGHLMISKLERGSSELAFFIPANHYSIHTETNQPSLINKYLINKYLKKEFTCSIALKARFLSRSIINVLITCCLNWESVWTRSSSLLSAIGSLKQNWIDACAFYRTL